ncbi:MAG: hypothetical protein HDR21_03430 [Lachnospiraceae bacterium]|nr:hypothetical protein [Lachnospiraceae bacterium]MBD5482947.1 hypothetical protein [Lachnospiraceae bacterium]
MKALLRFNYLMYMSKFHFLLPFTFILVYSGLLYVLSIFLFSHCFVISTALLFAISLLDGFYAYKLCRDNMQAILMMKSGSAVKCYISRELLLVLLAVQYTVLILLYPSIISLLGSGKLSRIVTDLAAILFLHLFVALCGYEIGGLFQPKIIGRRVPAALLMLGTIAGIFLRQELSMIPIIKYLFWIFPPIAKLLRLVYDKEMFFTAEMGSMIIQLFLYTSLVLAAKAYLQSRRKWAIYE